MLGWLVTGRIAGFEPDYDYDLSYARNMYDASPRTFFRFSKILGISSHRVNVPIDAWYAAKLAATLSEDCGSCTQLVVKLAEREGVSPAAIAAVLRDDRDAMPADASLGFRFAQAVLRRAIAESDRWRRQTVTQWGNQALVSLALTMASSRLCPSLKYALGHGHACTRVSLAGCEVAVNH
jgi:hypothetical protein